MKLFPTVIAIVFGLIMHYLAADENTLDSDSFSTDNETSTEFPPGPFRSRRNFGETCNKALRCDKKAWLNCIDGRCNCMRPDEMMYVANKSKCVSKSGERCKFQVLAQESDNMALVEKTECVDNAECASSGTCVCLKNFFENYNGTCTPKRGHNEACVMDVECKDETYLSCVDGTCTCATNQIIGKNGDICYGMAGKTLTKSKNCIEGSTLNSNGACLCDNPKVNYAGIDGRCHLRKSHGEVCTEDVECEFDKAYLKCINGTCGCDPSNSQYREFVEYIEVEKEREERNTRRRYNNDPYYIKVTYTETERKSFKQCVGLAGQNCSRNEKCIENSACRSRSNTGTVAQKVCQCNSGYSQSSTGICGIGYNQGCSPTSACSDSFVCTESVCGCPRPNHQVYNSSLDKCVGIVHGICSDDSECFDNTKCILNTISNVKQCECASGTVENAAGSCDLAFESPCIYGSKPSCDQLAGLKCRNGICACPDPTTNFNKDTRQCLGLCGSRCGTEAACVANSNCFKAAPNLPGICKCHTDYSVNSDRLCSAVRVSRSA